MPAALSVVLCAHNPRPEFLERTLAGLRAQTLPVDRWELLLVDNASREPLAARYSLAWHPGARHLVESQLGLTRARLAGIATAATELIVFVDDDNILDPDYLEQALAIAGSHPFIGAWGGRVVGEFETPPPAWTEPWLQMLALRDVPRDLWSNAIQQTDATPCGAGMCVRTRVAREWARLTREDPLRLALGRTGNSMSSDEDTDLALVACDLGLGTGMFRALRLLHLIPRGRLDPAYLERLAEGIARSHVLLRSIREPGLPPPAPSSRLQRLQQAYFLWRQPAPVRALHQAVARGTQAAYAQLNRRSAGTGS